MNTIPVPPAVPTPSGSALLSLDREELRLASPHGDVASGAVTLTNRGDAPLEGTITTRLGDTWLRVEPAALRLAPSEALRVEVRADPAGLPPGYTRGEIEIVSNGGTASVAVRLGVRTARSWRMFALAVVVSVAAATAVGVLLAKVQIPTGPVITLPAATTARHTTHAAHSARLLSAAEQRAALAAIHAAIVNSNAAWQDALTRPSAAGLAAVKTGRDLTRVSAEAQALLANGEQWRIEQSGFTVSDLRVAPDGNSGWGDVRKTERRALYGLGPTRAPSNQSDAVYELRYSLAPHGGRWLVDDVAVKSLTPLATGSMPALSVQQVFNKVAPAVMHVEADGGGGIAVGTGITIRSLARVSYVITNDHVVNGASTLKLQQWKGSGYYPANPWVTTTWWEDQPDDLAVIRIDQGNLPVASWGDSQQLQPAQEVVAIGYAENLDGGPTVTDGIVSSLRRTAPGSPAGPFYIGHSATINHGNSGGPLLDMSGRVVGINTWTLDNTQGLFFAIPASRAAPVAAGFAGSNG